MSHATDIVGYIYGADEYCPSCIVEVVSQRPQSPRETNMHVIEDCLDELADDRGIDRTDESYFDSDDFPKVIFRDQLIYGDEGYGDGKDHASRCGRCGELLGE